MERIASKEAGPIGIRWVQTPGGERSYEVFTIGGVDYTRGSPPDVVVTFADGLAELKLKKWVDKPKPLCHKHKGYKAQRKPRSNCKECNKAYEVSHEIDKQKQEQIDQAASQVIVDGGGLKIQRLKDKGLWSDLELI